MIAYRNNVMLIKKSKLIFIILLFALILLRVPSLFEPTWYGDEGIYASVGSELNRGEILYKDIWDNKTPGIYHIYGLIIKIFGTDLFWVRLFSLFSTLFTFYLFYKIFKLIFPKRNFLFPGLMFLFFWGTPIIEANIANAENFFILLTTAGLYLFLKYIYKKPNPWYLVSIGILFGLAFLLKVHPLFDFVAIIAALYVISIKDNAQSFLRKYIFNKDVIILGGSFGFVILAFVIFSYIQGNLRDFVQMFFSQKDTYILSYNQGAPEYWLRDIDNLRNRTILLGISFAGLIALYLKNYLNKKLFILLFVFIFSVYAANFSGRFYSHYFSQIIIPSILLGLYLLGLVKNQILRKVIQISILCFFWIFLSIWTFIHFTPPIRPLIISPINYYSNFVEYSLGLKSTKQYKSYFEYSTDIENLVEHISDLKNKSVVLLDDSPWFYTIAQVENGNKYTVIYHIYQDHVDIQSWTNSLAKSSEYIIQNINRPYPVDIKILDNLLTNYYKLDRKVGIYNIYKRL